MNNDIQDNPKPDPAPAPQSPAGGDILGMAPAKYTKICYILFLVSSGLGLLFYLLALIGITLPFMNLVSLAGLAGLVMVLLGFFVFKDKLDKMNHSHMGYLSALVGIFFALGMVISVVTGSVQQPYIAYLVSFLLSIPLLVFVYAGFKLWQNGENAGKDSAIAMVKKLVKKG